MTNALNFIVPVILVGYILFVLFRLYLNRKLTVERREYEAVIQKKMDDLQTDIHQRSQNLQDSIQMINQEYTKLMRDMSLEQRKGVTKIMQDLDQKNAPPSPSTSNDNHGDGPADTP